MDELATTIVDAIIKDLRGRAEVGDGWDRLYEDGQAFVRYEWIKIARKILKGD